MNSSSFQTKLDRSIHYDRFSCHGSEKSLISCSKSTHYSVANELAAAARCGICECDDSSENTTRGKRSTNEHDKKANNKQDTNAIMVTEIFIGGSVFGTVGTMTIAVLIK